MKKIEVGDAVELFINGMTSEDSFKVVQMRYPTSFVRLLEVEA